MNRTTFYDVRASRIPEAVGKCSSDTPGLLSIINEAIQRLVFAGGETGWWGGWVKMAFNVVPATSQYITTPRDVARIINMDVCKDPIRIQNEFYEFLEFGAGLQDENSSCVCANQQSQIQSFDRGMYPTYVDLTPGNILRIYATNASDVASSKRVFIQGNDTNDNPIYTLDNGVQVTGFFTTLASPFVDTGYALNAITRIQKDTTLGPVSIYEVDATTGAETLLVTLAPGETNPGFRRYFLNHLPCQCTGCGSVANTVQVVGMCKLDYVPVTCDTDPLIIGNIPALKHECMSIRYGEMDSENAQRLSVNHHMLAIRELNRELIHYLGKEQVAIQCKPWGNATLKRAGLNMI